MCRFIISLSKTTHQMLCEHPVNQRQQKKAVGVGIQGDRGRGAWTKIENGG